MPTSDLDDTDRELLALLQEDARRTVADIAQRVSLSPSAVKRRIDRLEATGVITGYTVVLDQAKLGAALEAFTELRFAGTTNVAEISATVTDLPEVRAMFMTAGDPDALVWLQVTDVAHLKRTIDHLRRTGRVTGTKTLMVLDKWIGPESRVNGASNARPGAGEADRS